MACRFCARRRASDLQVFTRAWLCKWHLLHFFTQPPKALCHVREKTFGQATMAFYGLFACHPPHRVPHDPAVELFGGDTPSRNRSSCGWHRMRSGALSESVANPLCFTLVDFFLQVPSAEVLPRESPKDVRSLGPVQLGVGSQIAHLIIWPRNRYIYIYISYKYI